MSEMWEGSKRVSVWRDPAKVEEQIRYLTEDLAYREKHFFPFSDKRERTYLQEILKSLHYYRLFLQENFSYEG